MLLYIQINESQINLILMLYLSANYCAQVWLSQQAAKGELLPLGPSQFEEMMDRLEKGSGW